MMVYRAHNNISKCVSVPLISITITINHYYIVYTAILRTLNYYLTLFIICIHIYIYIDTYYYFGRHYDNNW